MAQSLKVLLLFLKGFFLVNRFILNAIGLFLQIFGDMKDQLLIDRLTLIYFHIKIVEI